MPKNEKNVRLEGRVRESQDDFLKVKAYDNGESRNEELRKALDRDPEYHAMMEEVENGTEKGKEYLRKVAIARRSFAERRIR